MFEGKYTLKINIEKNEDGWWADIYPIPLDVAEGFGNTPEEAVIDLIEDMLENIPSIREGSEHIFGMLSCTMEGFRRNYIDE